ncbi:MAG: glycosyltransferase family 39 protein [Bacilli bacterium]|nr:glycosyltransferase family 39 protein [Bacilli bacterium]
MKKIITNIIKNIYLILIFLILIVGILSGLKNDLLLFIISLLLITFLFFIEKKYSIIKHILKNKKSIIFLISIGIILRILLLLFNYGEVFSDEATFYSNAINLSLHDPLNNRYIAMFPYLYSYIFLLGNIMKIFTTKFIIVVILNIIMDITASYFAYLFGKKIKNKEFGILLMIIWLLNPFQILWCMKALPITVVNLCFIVSLYIFACLIKQNKTINVILLSILLGINLGISNSFRPIFIILVIAIFLYYLYLIIFLKSNYKNKLFSFILILLCFIGINNSYTKIVSNKTKYKIDSSSGWTLYLGSNLESNGAWFSSDEYNELMASDNFNPSDIHKYFKNKAIENYKSYNILKIIKLYAKKYSILTSNLSFYTYENTIGTYINKNIIRIILYIFWFILLLSNIYTILRKNKNIDDILFIMVLEIGLILSHLLVEVSPRYFIPATVPIMIIAAFNIYNTKLDKKSIINRNE